jgi:hypothetical protein
MRRSALLAIALLTAVTACGASIQAVYEGDVRFEHCMALDSRPDTKPTLLSACWEEWVKFYTFGQTRDRVEYAKLRQKQLSTSSDFDEGEWAAQNTRAAVPEPTSVLEPPPMTLASDGGGAPPPPEDAGADGGVDAGGDAAIPPPPGAACGSECDESWTFCRKECKSAACEKGCAGNHKRCMRKCF